MDAICPDCEGSGFRIVETAGRRLAARCGCALHSRRERLLTRARVPRRYLQCELGNFDEMTADLKKARRLALEFVQAYPDVEGGLMFLGPPGVGKTHLAVSVLKRLIAEKGAAGLFYDFRELLKAIQGTYDPASQGSELEILQPVVSVDALVLDDLGSGRPTGWVQETLFYILTSRYNERKTTIVTSNLPDVPTERMQKRETLEGVIGSALRSRLAEMCRSITIEDSPDYRRSFRSRTPLHPF
ncbi:MAG: DNA replication protein DnaC [Acidobacteria bacterium]|nr:MAG: DNA replication protein DnaC [Acidobacteriota bacterium]